MDKSDSQKPRSWTVDLAAPTDHLPVFKLVDGKLMRKEGDIRDPNRRYSSVSNVLDGSSYLREFTDQEEKEADEAAAKWEAEAPLREAEEKRQKEEQLAFQNSIKYENRIVAFIDVLGWAQATKDSEKVSDEKHVQNLGLALALNHQLVELQRNASRMGIHEPYDLQLTSFSDCLILSFKPDESGRYLYDSGRHQLISNLYLLCRTMTHHGYLFRGGIAEGSLYHTDKMIFGPALIEAYELESQKANYPRIILSPKLEAKWGQGIFGIDGQHKTWRKDEDGYRFFDFLQPFGGDPFFLRTIDAIKFDIESLRKLIITKANEHRENSKILPKYVWLAKYFNNVCLEIEGLGTYHIDANEMTQLFYEQSD